MLQKLQRHHKFAYNSTQGFILDDDEEEEKSFQGLIDQPAEEGMGG